MLVIAILFLRESLEAALLISILMAITYKSGLSRLWIVAALAISFVLSGISAALLESITNLFDGLGQELMNAALLMLINLVMLLIYIFYLPLVPLPTGTQRRDNAGSSLPLLFVIATIISITHEGGELSVFSYGYMATRQSITALLTGGTIGVAIGASVGAIIYYLLVMMPDRTANRVFPVILALIASGMSLQAATYLVQAGWLPATPPVWDSSFLVAEDSLAGQLLYALFDYEATPDRFQCGFYLASISCFLVAVGLSRWRRVN